jgi:hypothetical protein
MPPQIYPPLPEPKPDLDNLLSVVTALRQTIETLIGVRGLNGWANQTFYQRNKPEASKVGDMWVLPATLSGELDIVSVWNGSTWQRLNF